MNPRLISQLTALLTGLLTLAWLAAPSHAQDTVTLRSVARIDTGAPITLSAIAMLDGPLLASIAATEIALPEAQSTALPNGWQRLEQADVRTALVAALGERGDMVIIRGGPCDVRRLAPSTDQPAAVPAMIEHEPTPDASADVTLDTVRGHLARQIATMLSAEPTELRLSFQDRDSALLDTLDAGRVVDVRPLGHGSRMPFAVKVFEGDRIVIEGITRVEVTRRMPVAIVARPISRGSIVRLDDITNDQQWLETDVDAAPAASVIGQVARGSLQPGALILHSHVEQPIVIRRGEPAVVDVIVGSIAIAVEYRASENAAVGDVIEFVDKNDRTNTLRARVTGPGRAVSLSEPDQHQTDPAQSDHEASP